MANNEENINYENLNNEVQKLEDKYDVKINYHRKGSIKSKMKTAVIAGLIVASFVSGSVVSEKFVDYVQEQRQISNMLKYDINTGKFYYDESKQFHQNAINFLFDFENGTVTLCELDIDAHTYEQEWNYHDFKTGSKVFSKGNKTTLIGNGISKDGEKEIVSYAWLVSNFDYDVKTGVVKKFYFKDEFQNEKYSKFEDINELEKGKREAEVSQLSERPQQLDYQLYFHNNTGLITCNNGTYYELSDVFAVCDENNKITFCIRQNNVKRDTGIYNILYSIRTGEEVLALDVINENSDYKKVKEGKIKYKSLSNLSFDSNALTGEIVAVYFNGKDNILSNQANKIEQGKSK